MRDRFDEPRTGCGGTLPAAEVVPSLLVLALPLPVLDPEPEPEPEPARSVT